jgi:6-pyruvoyltetrahydropterin/6-carboxytetrahydropterin synthase
MPWLSTVKGMISSSHSNGPEGGKCYNDHGHDFLFEVVFEYTDLDEYGWGPNFSDLKQLVKQTLGFLDHANLNKQLAFPPSSENLAQFVFNDIQSRVFGLGYLRVDSVTVREGDGNQVTYRE